MKVLIIGLGSIASKHINALKKVQPSCQIFALRSSANAVAVEGVGNFFSWEEAEESGSFDFAIISNPTSEHSKAIRKLVRFNCPLFIEKPVLDSLVDANALDALLAEKQILTYVACNMRFHPCITFIKKYLETEKPRIQEVNSYCGSYLPNWRPNKNFRELYSANIDMGGGVHLDLIHELDYLTWIFGRPENSTSYFRNASALNISAVDYAHYVLDYNKFIASVTLNYYRKVSKRSFEILTEDAVLSIDLIGMKVMKNEEVIFTASNNFLDTYTTQIEYFINAIRKKVIPMNSFAEAIRTLKVCLT